MLKTKAEPAEQAEEIRQVPITELHPFKDHPFKVLDDEAMLKTVESVARFGLLTPLVVRPRQESGYEIISGHRRQHAAQLAGLKRIVAVRPHKHLRAARFGVDYHFHPQIGAEVKTLYIHVQTLKVRARGRCQKRYPQVLLLPGLGLRGQGFRLSKECRVNLAVVGVEIGAPNEIL